MKVKSLEKEKEKGKGKEIMNDQIEALLEDNRYFKKKYDQIFDMYQELMKRFPSQSNTTPQPSDHESLQIIVMQLRAIEDIKLLHPNSSSMLDLLNVKFVECYICLIFVEC